MPFRLAVFLAAATCFGVHAQSADAVRKEIEAAYVKALDAFRQAKSIEDLDEINRSFDTQDWQTISPGQQPRNWPDLRKYGFDGLWSPSQSTELIIDTFELKGGTAVLTGRLRNVGMKGDVSFIPLKETWKRTVVGWKRQVHQKFAPGETPK
jgi:hypothetical protein